MEAIINDVIIHVVDIFIRSVKVTMVITKEIPEAEHPHSDDEAEDIIEIPAKVETESEANRSILGDHVPSPDLSHKLGHSAKLESDRVKEAVPGPWVK